MKQRFFLKKIRGLVLIEGTVIFWERASQSSEGDRTYSPVGLEVLQRSTTSKPNGLAQRFTLVPMRIDYALETQLLSLVGLFS